MTEREIFNYLVDLSGSEAFAAALMGNMRAESALKSDNMQNSFEARLKHTDESYTKAVDNGVITRDSFVHDAVGYGLCQWTYHTRKAALYDYAKKWCCSIGDAEMQVTFAVHEMSINYKGIWDNRKTKTLEDLCRLIHINYENPANKSEQAQQLRISYAKVYFEKYSQQHDTNDIKIDLQAKVNKLAEILSEIKVNMMLDLVDEIREGLKNV